ncbi:secretin receptor-like [Embiotoca jacksoni]|uniref:secretin receptor-like n=1 Tax=Embiotoca jacksoni TaxID=100190 RepID=UPI003704AD3A
MTCEGFRLCDGVSCWPTASEGRVVSARCPPLLLKPETPPALITRRCTAAGWSEPSPPYYTACRYEEDEQEDEQEDEVWKEKTYFDTVKLMYSVEYGASLAALLVAVLLFCCFRKLLCTRNYIHLHLFTSFMLRSLAVFIKDAVLFTDNSMDRCTASTVRPQTPNTLTCMSPDSKHVNASVNRCWDDLESRSWWVIKIPVLLCIFLNLVIFLNISRIIVQKTKATREPTRDSSLQDAPLLHPPPDPFVQDSLCGVRSDPGAHRRRASTLLGVSFRLLSGNASFIPPTNKDKHIVS